MKRSFLYLVVIAIAFTACRESEETTQPVKKDYTPMAVGNYWVYNNYKVHADGSKDLLDEKDSIFITGKKTNNGKEYFEFKGIQYLSPDTTIAYYRDSSDYLVDDKGNIHFSASNFHDTLNQKLQYKQNTTDTLYLATYKMEKENDPVSVPAGTFNVLSFRCTIFMPDPPNPDFERRYTNQYYAKNIGRISNVVLFVFGDIRYEKELVRYHLND